jgi:serine phosphatase RsbU (regulator of sigma subunit)
VLKRVGIKTETNVINVSERRDLGFLAQFDIERILIAPLKVEGRTKGFIFLARSFEEEGFDDDEIIAVSGLADYASLAISKAELLKASIEKERMEKELEVAREIQRKIIPERLPAFENFDVAAQFIPAFEVGGDYYDFFRLKNSIAFVLADVSGKGVEASYIMAEMKGIFEALAVTEDEIENLIVKANGLFEKRLKRKHFVTAVIGLIKNDAIVFYRIGHNKPILIDAERNAKFIESKGLAFGLTENKRFAENLEAEKIVLRTGESLVFYTDGVNEARNEKGEEFGYERFFDTLISNATKSAHETAIAVIKKVSVFASKNLQNDDITLLIFKKK